MRIDVSTVIKQDEFVQGFKNGFMTVESKYGWICPACGKYVEDYMLETFSYYNRDPLVRDTVITRNIEFPDNHVWECKNCREV